MEKPYVIGIDMGGQSTKLGIVDARGCIPYSASVAVEKDTGQYKENIHEYIADVAGALQEIVDKAGGKELIRGIGVGAPNGNYYTGNIDLGANLPWKGQIPLAKLIMDKVGIPVTLTNDANAAAIGEMTYGAARGMKDFIVITLGTGVGGGVVAGGNLVYGHDGFAGELGHVIVRRENGRPCGCGRCGCLETYASATGVVRTARELLTQRTDYSLLRELHPESISAKDVYEAAIRSDELSVDIFEQTGQILGEAFADFIAFSSPEAIILFGGLTKAGELLRKPILRSMEKNVLSIYRDKTKLLFSQLNESDAAILGASALGWEAKN